MGVVEQGRDLFAAAWVAGQDHIAAHIALHAVDMELFVQLLHSCTSLVIDSLDSVIITQGTAGCKWNALLRPLRRLDGVLAEDGGGDGAYAAGNRG